MRTRLCRNGRNKSAGPPSNALFVEVISVKKPIVFAILCTLAAAASAQQSIADEFESRSLTREGFTMPYRLFVPADYDAAQAYPLVLTLHGAGERGTDNERQIALHRLATSWADPVNQAEHPTFVVAPQVPPGGRWTADLPVGQSDFSQEELTTLAILDSLAVEFNIDPDRVYITGLSMGGHGVWDLISRLPERFAAAVPMSGNADPTQATKLLHMPIWAFHGESDTVVRPASARSMIQKLEDRGRNVVYTDCLRAPVSEINFDCPGTISNDSLSEAIANRADLIFKSVRLGGHGPWSVWYDHPLLADWVFSKRRVFSSAVLVTTPRSGELWDGSVSWTAGEAATDSVEIWISLDNGATWKLAEKTVVGAGAAVLDASDYPDAGVARIRLFALDAEGRVYSRQTSGPFRIDNAGDGAPFLDVDDERLRFDPSPIEERLFLSMTLADPEGAVISREIYYSADAGLVYALAHASDIEPGISSQSIDMDVTLLPNSSEARVRIDVSDGANRVSDETAVFVKRTPRIANDYVEHTAGEGVGTITLHFIEPENLTSHRYRITFDSSDPVAKTYSVIDLDEGETLLTGVPLSDGVHESPVFDGMSLVVQDLENGMANLEETGWISGDSDLSVAVTGGRVRIAILFVDLLDTEDEYEITMAESVADTSIAMFGMPARELYFTVTAHSDGAQRDVLFDDQNSDGRLGDGDVLYILEENAEGEPAPAWEFRFTASADTRLPDSGDTFLFVPVHKLSSADVFEFIAMEGVSVEEAPESIARSVLAYPNPFIDHVTVKYRLTQPSEVSLEVHDVLGRRVAVLQNLQVAAGDHHVMWSSAAQLPAGLYFVQLRAMPTGGDESVVERFSIIKL